MIIITFVKSKLEDVGNQSVENDSNVSSSYMLNKI